MKQHVIYKNRVYSHTGNTEKQIINCFDDIETAELYRKEMQRKYENYNHIANGKQFVFFSIDE